MPEGSESLWACRHRETPHGNAMHALMTGASEGIGRCAAELLLDEGWEVWGTSRKGQLPWTHPRLHTLRLDLEDRRSVEAAAELFLKEAGRIDLLLNNGGVGVWGALEEISHQDLRSQFEVLVFGPLALTQALLPALRESKGCVINVTSLASDFPIPFLGTYSGAKAAWSNMSQGLQLELAGSGVRIVDLRPGDIASKFHQSMQMPDGSPLYQEAARRCHAAIGKAMAAAPPPICIAQKILSLATDPSAPERVPAGSFFQSVLGPLGKRFLSQRWLNWILRKLYDLPS